MSSHTQSYIVVVSPKGRPQTRHEITASSIEDARRQEIRLGALRATCHTHLKVTA